jgi:hypothetical protein
VSAPPLPSRNATQVLVSAAIIDQLSAPPTCG